MKFSNIIIGFVIFSVFMVLMISFAYDLSDTYETQDEAQLKTLVGDYNFVGNFSTSDTSTIRKVSEASESGIIEKDTDTDLISGGLAGTRLLAGSIGTINKVVKTASSDIGIPPIIVAAVIGIFTIILVLIGLALLMRKNPEI